jgi:hypothetical protein
MSERNTHGFEGEAFIPIITIITLHETVGVQEWQQSRKGKEIVHKHYSYLGQIKMLEETKQDAMLEVETVVDLIRMGSFSHIDKTSKAMATI